LEQIVRVKGGPEALLFEALIGGPALLEEVEGNMAQHRKIFGPVADGNPVVVLPEDQVERPMHDVLNLPVAAYRRAKRPGVPVQTTDVKALVDAPFFVDLAFGEHHTGRSFRAAEDSADRDRQDVQQLMIVRPLNAWVGQCPKWVAMLVRYPSAMVRLRRVPRFLLTGYLVGTTLATRRPRDAGMVRIRHHHAE